MIKLVKRVLFVGLIVSLVWCGMLIADRQRLSNELIRLHVVADSNEESAQELKQQVRQAIVESLQSGLENLTDVEQARAYLKEQLPRLEHLANQVLSAAGSQLRAVVSMTREAFSQRDYDTFRLPAGVYEAIRVVIGEGQGQNWWCVAFPQLCLPTTSDGFRDVAAGSGFAGSLTDTLTGKDGHEVRFFFLDLLGRIENFFFDG